MIRKYLSILALPAVLMLGACDDNDDPITVTDEGNNIVAVAQSAGSFNTLLTALDAAGLTSALESGGPFTVFAPSDDAFAAIDPATLNSILADTELLTSILTFHVVPGTLRASDVVSSTGATTLNGAHVSFSVLNGNVRVADANVTATDIEASNGIIHVIDKVIFPEPIQDIVGVAQTAGIFNTLLVAAEAAGLVGALQGDGPLTVFAPTDDAFAAIDSELLGDLVSDTELLTSVLLYHVAPGFFGSDNVIASVGSSIPSLNGKLLEVTSNGGGLQVAGANIIATDFLATNGVVHVIDQVMLPGPIADIVQTAKGAGIFNTLLAAVEAAGLTDALKGDGPFTVFAPTDDAFAAIDSEVLSDLIADPELLTSVLLYHVVPGSFLAGNVLYLDSAPTLNGKEVSIMADENGVMVDGANVIATDVLAKNGVVHVIDQVILPEPIADIIQTAKGAGIFNTLLAAVEAAGLTDVLKGDGPFTVFAPTDEAFAAIPAADLNALLANADALTAVLTYHVVPGALSAQDVLSSASLATVNGSSAPISLDGDGNPRIDDAIITATDINTRNGVVHVIDRVIFPN